MANEAGTDGIQSQALDGNWSLELRLYDSSVNSGNTSLSNITWNATSSGSRTIKTQINYKNENTNKAYQPGELVIRIPTLNQYINGYVYNTNVGADSYYSTNKVFDWSYYLDQTTMEYIFTNNYYIEKDTNVEGEYTNSI